MTAPTLPWSNRFATLGSDFSVPMQTTPLPSPYWVGHSAKVANDLGLPCNWAQSNDWLQVFSGNRSIAGSTPLSSVYSGHQFGVWAGQLGDGRAILLGDTAGQEVQLKGAGLTPFSRMGDGRAVLRSSIREFLCSEAMHGLGIPTSRALCITGSDAPIYREEAETAAVVTRTAPSFIRFGHFEHFCHTHQGTQQGAAPFKELKILADFVIDHYYPHCRTETRWGNNPYAALLQVVTERTAKLMAQWQSVGFCHGVMNTDNMSILGLTLDYGPFQFLDAYDPQHICNHSDHQGRYAFAKQPNVAYWNLFCLGQALMPLIEAQEPAMAALETYKTAYPQAFAQCMAAKLGFSETSAPIEALSTEILQSMAADRVDYSIFWRTLSHWAKRGAMADPSVKDLFINTAAPNDWLPKFTALIEQNKSTWSSALMLSSNPKYVLRNHLGEQAIQAAKGKDFAPVSDLLQVLERPFDEHPKFEAFAAFPPDWAATIAISCSS